MKTNRQVLLAITATLVLAADVQAGRWLSRDPIRDAGFVERDPLPEMEFLEPQQNEPYLYVFVANDPVNAVDFAGLWRIQRAGGSKASAKPDPGDTVAGLAGIIGLNALEYRNWLSLVGPTPMPAAVNQPITQCSEFRIPNTVVAYWAGNAGAIGRWWVSWNSSVGYLQDRGFNVVNFHHTRGDRYRLRDELLSRADAKALHGLYFWGHGNTQVLASKHGDVLVDYARFSLSYKMALGLVFACDSNSGRSAFMSGNGIWNGYTGILYPLPPWTFDADKYIHPGNQATKE